MTDKKKGGRPAWAKAEWNQDTFRQIYRSCYSRVAELAEDLELPPHLVYAWTAEFETRVPTPQQRDAVAAALSARLGTKIRSSDLARSVQSIRFRFVD
jgi:hypothetical protein